MTSDELMQLSAEKAVAEVSWKSIEFLFAPVTMLELLLRLDYQGMQDKVLAMCTSNSPDAIPHRFRGPYIAEMLGAVKRERFYRAMLLVKGTEER